jgi:hypothetical protein
MKAWRERWTDSQFGTHVGYFFILIESISTKQKNFSTTIIFLLDLEGQ